MLGIYAQLVQVMHNAQVSSQELNHIVYQGLVLHACLTLIVYHLPIYFALVIPAPHVLVILNALECFQELCLSAHLEDV